MLRLGDFICLLPSLLAAMIKSLPPRLPRWKESRLCRRLVCSASFDVGSSDACLRHQIAFHLFLNACGHCLPKPIPLPVLEASFKG